MTMTMRLLKTPCIIRRHYTFLSLVSTSRFHYKHRSHYHHSNGNKPINVTPHVVHSSYLTSKHRLHRTSSCFPHHHHTKYYFNHSAITTTKESISYKTGYILHNICYCTLDSIVSPRRGYDRLSTFCVATKGHLLHFWCGTKLMCRDMQSGMQILRKLSKGDATSYRERRELRRVTMDALKFVPMAIIILIPFLEATLPFLLYLFPNMLPSRFQSEQVKLAKMKKLVSVRVGLAAFFEDALYEQIDIQKEKDESVAILLDKIQNNEHVSSTEITQCASLVHDESALDNAPHAVLSNLCRLMDLNAFGTSAMLRTRLYDAIREIRVEDEGIRREGLEHIPLARLEELLRDRGMSNDGNLSQWLQLSVDNQVSFSSLLMAQLLFAPQA